MKETELPINGYVQDSRLGHVVEGIQESIRM